jgi:hypothetical protein
MRLDRVGARVPDPCGRDASCAKHLAGSAASHVLAVFAPAVITTIAGASFLVDSLPRNNCLDLSSIAVCRRGRRRAGAQPSIGLAAERAESRVDAGTSAAGLARHRLDRLAVPAVSHLREALAGHGAPAISSPWPSQFGRRWRANNSA